MYTENKAMHIALTFDKNYLRPFYVLLTSIFINNKGVSVSFHVIASGLNSEQKDDLVEFCTKNSSSINFYDINEKEVEKFIVPNGYHFSLINYYRLFLIEMLPKSIDKVLYIDVDVLVVSNLQSLFEHNLGEYPVGAKIDNEMYIRQDLGIYDANYFNSGVMLINLAEWLKQDISQRAINFIVSFPDKVKFVDQDALNVILLGNWLKIDERYNIMPIDVPYYADEIAALMKDAVIIHYCGRKKPWNYECNNRLRFAYFDYLEKSPYRKEARYVDFSYKMPILLTLAKQSLIDFSYRYPALNKAIKRIKKSFTI